MWIPLADLETRLEYENHTAYPSRGNILLYPGGLSETEVRGQLTEFGKLVLWQGAQEIIFSGA